MFHLRTFYASDNRAEVRFELNPALQGFLGIKHAEAEGNPPRYYVADVLGHGFIFFEEGTHPVEKIAGNMFADIDGKTLRCWKIPVKNPSTLRVELPTSAVALRAGHYQLEKSGDMVTVAESEAHDNHTGRPAVNVTNIVNAAPTKRHQWHLDEGFLAKVNDIICSLMLKPGRIMNLSEVMENYTINNKVTDAAEIKQLRKYVQNELVALAEKHPYSWVCINPAKRAYMVAYTRGTLRARL